MKENDILSEKEIRANLNKELTNLPVIVKATLDSTNSEARRLILDGNFSDGLIIADSQTNGRGRIGHSFYSPKSSGIYMTYVFTPADLSDAHRLTTKTSVAVIEAISHLYQISPKIKWVNDIYYNERKICGILSEAVTTGVNKGSLLVGIGINFSSSDLPSDIMDIAGFLPERASVTRNRLISEIVNRLYPETINLSSKEYIKKYREASMLTGTDITYYENEIQKEAHVIGIDDDAGLMVILPDGSQTTLRNGEVFTIRKKN